MVMRSIEFRKLMLQHFQFSSVVWDTCSTLRSTAVPAGTAVAKFSSFFTRLNDYICFLSEPHRPPWWCVERNDNYHRWEKSVHDSLTFVDRVTVANRFYALLVRFSRRDVGYERLR